MPTQQGIDDDVINKPQTQQCGIKAIRPYLGSCTAYGCNCFQEGLQSKQASKTCISASRITRRPTIRAPDTGKGNNCDCNGRLMRAAANAMTTTEPPRPTHQHSACPTTNIAVCSAHLTQSGSGSAAARRQVLIAAAAAAAGGGRSRHQFLVATHRHAATLSMRVTRVGCPVALAPAGTTRHAQSPFININIPVVCWGVLSEQLLLSSQHLGSQGCSGTRLCRRAPRPPAITRQAPHDAAV